MNAPINPIDNLRDIHLPADPGIWPPAIGWWIVTLIIVILLIKFITSIIRWHRQSLELKEFRRQVAAVQVDGLKTPAEKQSAIATMTVLVKQLCIHLLGRKNVAAVHGQSFLTLLDQLTASTGFSNGPGQLLGKGAYQQDASGDIVALKKTILDSLTRRSVLKTAKEMSVNER